MRCKGAMRRFMRRYVLVALAVFALGLSQGIGLQGQTTVPGIDRPVVVVRGRITSDTTWQSQYYYLLRGAVFVDSGATLTIQAGTTVVGELATIGTLVVACLAAAITVPAVTKIKSTFSRSKFFAAASAALVSPLVSSIARVNCFPSASPNSFRPARRPSMMSRNGPPG